MYFSSFGPPPTSGIKWQSKFLGHFAIFHSHFRKNREIVGKKFNKNIIKQLFQKSQEFPLRDLKGSAIFQNIFPYLSSVKVQKTVLKIFRYIFQGFQKLTGRAPPPPTHTHFMEQMMRIEQFRTFFHISEFILDRKM